MAQIGLTCEIVESETELYDFDVFLTVEFEVISNLLLLFLFITHAKATGLSLSISLALPLSLYLSLPFSLFLLLSKYVLCKFCGMVFLLYLLEMFLKGVYIIKATFCVLQGGIVKFKIRHFVCGLPLSIFFLYITLSYKVHE